MGEILGSRNAGSKDVNVFKAFVRNCQIPFRKDELISIPNSIIWDFLFILKI